MTVLTKQTAELQDSQTPQLEKEAGGTNGRSTAMHRLRIGPPTDAMDSRLHHHRKLRRVRAGGH